MNDKQFKEFLESESGATAIEYTMIAMFLAICLIAGTPLVATAINAKFSIIASGINAAK